MACNLKQDCIAVFDETEEKGALIGEFWEKWGLFKPEFFQKFKQPETDLLNFGYIQHLTNCGKLLNRGKSLYDSERFCNSIVKNDIEQLAKTVKAV